LRAGEVVSLTLPGNAFADPNGQTLSYKATLPNGPALPGWLTELQQRDLLHA
jgi:hypothetical protein